MMTMTNLFNSRNKTLRKYIHKMQSMDQRKRVQRSLLQLLNNQSFRIRNHSLTIYKYIRHLITFLMYFIRNLKDRLYLTFLWL